MGFKVEISLENGIGSKDIVEYPWGPGNASRFSDSALEVAPLKRCPSAQSNPDNTTLDDMTPQFNDAFLSTKLSIVDLP